MALKSQKADRRTNRTRRSLSSAKVFVAAASPPDSQHKPDQPKVDGDVTAIDQQVFERPLLEKRNDHEHRRRPTDARQQSGDEAPLPIRFAVSQKEREVV